MTESHGIMSLAMNHYFPHISYLVVLFLLPCPVYSQTAEELLQEIKQNTELLDATQKTQAQVLDGYYALQHQLDRRAKLIKAIQKEIQSTDGAVEASAMAVDALEIEIEQLKSEYSTILRQAFRLKKSRNDLLFLFSATSFNQGLKRWRYLQQYKEYRKKQVQLILEKRANLNQKIQDLTDSKQQQERWLKEEINQTKIAKEELDLKGTIVGQLKREARAINRLLKEQRQAHQRLAQSVESTIASDLLNREEPATEQPVATSEKRNPKKTLSPAISYEFIKRKGKFTWPIHQGVIVRYFGNQPHPIHKKIVINNNGLDIRARSKPTVFSLYEGMVKAIQVVPGYKNTVILQHGDFYTVYSNLEAVQVKKGDIVLTQQVIGEAAIPLQKEDPELHFELWKGKQRLNPFSWLGKL